MKQKDDEQAVIMAQPAFSKVQILKSKRYAAKRNVLAAVLKDGAEYTLAEADRALDLFLKKEVK